MTIRGQQKHCVIEPNIKIISCTAMPLYHYSYVLSLITNNTELFEIKVISD